MIKILSTMLCSILLFPQLLVAEWQEDFGALLAKYATPTGVRYSEWKNTPEDVKKLNEIVLTIGKHGPTSHDRATRLSYLLNAYNAWMLQLVLEHYPIKSIREIAPDFGVFSADRITVAGRRMSLNTLEKELIIKEFQEPRIHFAINCASFSCPPLAPQTFKASTLDSHLTMLTRAFVNSALAAKVNASRKNIELSMIFDWYADDFKAAGGPIAFLNHYRAEKLPTDFTVSYQEYDWSLNESR